MKTLNQKNHPNPIWVKEHKITSKSNTFPDSKNIFGNSGETNKINSGKFLSTIIHPIKGNARNNKELENDKSGKNLTGNCSAMGFEMDMVGTEEEENNYYNL